MTRKASFSVSYCKGQTQFRARGELDVENATEFAEVTAGLPADRDCIVDLTSTTNFDLACLASVLKLRRRLESCGRKLVVKVAGSGVTNRLLATMNPIVRLEMV